MNTITSSGRNLLQIKFSKFITKRLASITKAENLKVVEERDSKINETRFKENSCEDAEQRLKTNYCQDAEQDKTGRMNLTTIGSNTFTTRMENNNFHLTTQNSELIPNDYELIDFDKLNISESRQKRSVLDKCEEDISHVAPYLKPTFNFAAYVNQSETLQELLKLGVDLHKLEKKVTVPPFIMGLDFERDIKNHVIFLHDVGLEVEKIGAFITKSPYIFKQDLDDLRVRINYLESKKFSGEQIVRIIEHNPFWLMFSTKRIDTRLGFFQKEFNLTGPEVRHVTVTQPRLITYSLHSVKTNMFAIKEEMCFTEEEMKQLLLNRPNLYMKNQKNLLEIFEYLHREMKLSTEMITKIPGVLTCRLLRLQQRHRFLEKLGRAQYDPKKPMYVSVLTAMSGSDAKFCENVAKCPLDNFYTFIKTL